MAIQASNAHLLNEATEMLTLIWYFNIAFPGIDLILFFLPSSLPEVLGSSSIFSVSYKVVERNPPGKKGSIFCWSSSSLSRAGCLFRPGCPAVS